MLNFEISILDKASESSYNDLLLSCDSNLMYVSTSFKLLLEKHLACQSQYIVAKQEGKIIGALPLMIFENKKYGNVVNSLPYYGSNGGIILSNNIIQETRLEVAKGLLDFGLDILKNDNCAAYTFISNPLDVEVQKWMEFNIPHDYIDERIGQITQLPSYIDGFEDVLLKKFEDPRPRNIRKAIKSQVFVSVDNTLEAMNFLYDTHRQNIEGIGGLAKKESFFTDILSTLTDEEFKVYIAKVDNVPIAGLLLLYFNKTVEYFTPATLHDYIDLQPSSLLIFEAMKDAIKKHFKYWNWGGTWKTQNGVYDFKKKWGANDMSYFYYTKVLNTQLLSLSKDELLKEYPNFFVMPFNQLKS